VALGEAEQRPARPARVGAARGARVSAGDVDVEHRSAEELVPNGTADDPGLLSGEDLSSELEHR
jgi:hypothetical protein